MDPRHILNWQELADLQSLDIGGISCLNMPGVSRIILEDVINSIKPTPSPGFGSAVPFCVLRRERFVRHML